jgi:hypothetical protein
MMETNVKKMSLTDVKWKVWMLESEVEHSKKYNNPISNELWIDYIVWRGYLKQLEKNK